MLPEDEEPSEGTFSVCLANLKGVLSKDVSIREGSKVRLEADRLEGFRPADFELQAVVGRLDVLASDENGTNSPAGDFPIPPVNVDDGSN